MNTSATVSVYCLVIFALAGCATPLKPNEARITYKSEPPGAMIYEGEKAWGVAPVVLVVTASDASVKVGYATTKKMFAVWPSGAKSAISTRVTLGQGDREVTFSRPADAPGLDKDLAYLQKRKEESDGTSNAVMLGILKGIGDGLNAPAPSNQSINCTSFKTGNTVNTNCF